MFTVYVLYSESHQRIYVGYTSNMTSRLESHNIYSKKGYTARYRPWVLVHSENYDSKREALKREKELKSAKGREFIWNLIRSKLG